VALLAADEAEARFEFAIAMGVRPDDTPLQRALDASLARLRPQIDAVLREYAVVRPDDYPARGKRR
jgi:hypothetical protein